MKIYELHEDLKAWLVDKQAMAVEEAKQAVGRGCKLGVDCPAWDVIARTYQSTLLKIEALEVHYE